jgi:hypothetical protein
MFDAKRGSLGSVISRRTAANGFLGYGDLGHLEGDIWPSQTTFALTKINFSVRPVRGRCPIDSRVAEVRKKCPKLRGWTSSWKADGGGRERPKRV